MRIFLAINQNFKDGTAHSLYFLRHSWWLAKTKPDASVVMIHTKIKGTDGSKIGSESLEAAGLPGLPNLHFVALSVFDFKFPHARMRMSRYFYGKLARYLKAEAQQGDIFFTASFPALFSFIADHTNLREKLLMVYEVHALRELDNLLGRRMIRRERRALNQADLLPCTTESLEEIVQRIAPDKDTFVSGFGCGFNSEIFPHKTRTIFPENGVVGYIGSLYPIQGIVWLAENWTRVQARCGPVTLRVYGGNEFDLNYLKTHANQGVEIMGPVPSGSMPALTPKLDAMVIPSLNSGRMPLVVITKAYDYLAIGLPIVAAKISSIEEILEDEKHALLFTPGDLDGFCNHILRLRQPEVAKNLIHGAIERSRELSWEVRNTRFWNTLIAKVK